MSDHHRMPWVVGNWLYRPTPTRNFYVVMSKAEHGLVQDWIQVNIETYPHPRIIGRLSERGDTVIPMTAEFTSLPRNSGSWHHLDWQDCGVFQHVVDSPTTEQFQEAFTYCYRRETGQAEKDDRLEALVDRCHKAVGEPRT